MQFTNNFSGTKLTNYPQLLGSIEQKFVNTNKNRCRSQSKILFKSKLFVISTIILQYATIKLRLISKCYSFW